MELAILGRGRNGQTIGAQTLPHTPVHARTMAMNNLVPRTRAEPRVLTRVEIALPMAAICVCVFSHITNRHIGPALNEWIQHPSTFSGQHLRRQTTRGELDLHRGG